jgi:heme/copper-type cytochrome/quinol oxidase subunit 4
VFITGVVVFGSIMIMTHLNHNMMPMDELMKMQR